MDEPKGSRICVHALRVKVDPANAHLPKLERELEVVASFWLRTEYIVATFGGVVTDLRQRHGNRDAGPP